jgi:hypothetical protein
MAIVTTTYRYKRPPREKAKAATLTGPAVVRAELPTAGKVNAKAAGELHPSDGKPAAVAGRNTTPATDATARSSSDWLLAHHPERLVPSSA